MSDSPISIFTPGPLVNLPLPRVRYLRTRKDRLTPPWRDAFEAHGWDTERLEWIEPPLPLLQAPAIRIFNVETEQKGRLMRVTRWGNSLAVRIPKPLAEQTDIVEGSEVELSVTEGALTIRPKARSYSLEELLDQVTPENRHDEIDWGEPQGKEIW